MSTKDKIKAWLIGSIFLGIVLQMWFGILSGWVLIPGTYANDDGAIRFSWTKNFVWQEDGIELTGTYKKQGDIWQLYCQGPLALFYDYKVEVKSNSGGPSIKIRGGSNSEYARTFSISDSAVVFGASAALVGGVMIAKFISNKLEQKKKASKAPDVIDEVRENKPEETESTEEIADTEAKHKAAGFCEILRKASATDSGRKRGRIVLLAVSVLVLFLFLFTETCDECGSLILGKGYYTPKILLSAEAMKYTVCDTCADELWSPINYKIYAK